MSSDEVPTTAAEMELLDALDDVLDDAQAVELLAMTYSARLMMRLAAERYLRGEMSEEERRGWVRIVDETTPMIEAMMERNRDRECNDD
jgi:hypothetical protein